MAKKQNTTLKKEPDKKRLEQRTILKKGAMIKALEKTLGVVTNAAKSVGIERSAHYRWMEEDKDYKQQVEAISDIAIDFAESKLHTRIQDGDTTATIFYLKTKGKKRGYIERSEVDATVVYAGPVTKEEIQQAREKFDNEL